MPWFTKQCTVCFTTENFGCCNTSSAVVIRWLYFQVFSFYSVHSELLGVTLWLKPLWSQFCSSHSTHSLLTSALILLIKQDIKRYEEKAVTPNRLTGNRCLIIFGSFPSFCSGLSWMILRRSWKLLSIWNFGSVIDFRPSLGKDPGWAECFL